MKQLKTTSNKIFTLCLLSFFALPASITQAHTQNIASWGKLLNTYVSKGRVDYQSWKKSQADTAALSQFLNTADPAAGNKDSKTTIAFWINIYNACVIEQVLAQYPLKSVMDVKNFFKRKNCKISGASLSLDTIEKKKILQKYGESRAHYALVCGAKGCPTIIKKPYIAKTLNRTLNKQAKAYANGPGVKVADGSWQLSKIFEWYAGDFKKLKGGESNYPNNYIAGLLKSEKDATIVRSKSPQYFEYDWSLNSK